MVAQGQTVGTAESITYIQAVLPGIVIIIAQVGIDTALAGVHPGMKFTGLKTVTHPVFVTAVLAC